MTVLVPACISQLSPAVSHLPDFHELVFKSCDKSLGHESEDTGTLVNQSQRSPVTIKFLSLHLKTEGTNT